MTRSRFDLKQGEGGLVDLEFLLQGWCWRTRGPPALLVPRDTPGLLRSRARGGLVASAALRCRWRTAPCWRAGSIAHWIGGSVDCRWMRHQRGETAGDTRRGAGTGVDFTRGQAGRLAGASTP